MEWKTVNKDLTTNSKVDIARQAMERWAGMSIDQNVDISQIQNQRINCGWRKRIKIDAFMEKKLNGGGLIIALLNLLIVLFFHFIIIKHGWKC